jgi:hypothetical protein
MIFGSNRRHAELVSASILTRVTASPVEPWTLKQVQGDGDVDKCTARPFNPPRTGEVVRPFFKGVTVGHAVQAGFN